MKTKFEIMDIKKVLGNRSSWASIITQTEPRMRKTGNPFNDNKVLKISSYTCQLQGVDYAGKIENRMAKLHGEKVEFVPDEMRGMAWLKGFENLIAYNLQNPEQKYLRVYLTATCRPSVFYKIDGFMATEKQVSILKAFMYEKSESLKQSDIGLEGKEQIMPRSIKLENILSLTCGEFNYSK